MHISRAHSFPCKILPSLVDQIENLFVQIMWLTVVSDHWADCRAVIDGWHCVKLL